MVAGGGKSAEGSRRSRDKSAQWPRIQSWQNQAVMPGWSPPALEGHSAHVVQGRMYVFGGQSTESERGVELSLRCLPTRASAAARRRFAVDDRVACAVADASGAWTDWAAGTVLALESQVEEEGGVPGGLAPYEVRLDSGHTVLVHADEHYLLRDLALQPLGARRTQATVAPGSREHEVWIPIEERRAAKDSHL